MPSRLRPTAPPAADAILVGDPGRALLLAQEVLTEPKMSNHARGLWGYTGETASGRPLTVQSTGMGAPSAVTVLDDLAELGLRRAIRVGTCAGIGVTTSVGALLLVDEAVALGGSAASVGLLRGDSALPDRELHDRLGQALAGGAAPCRVGSSDLLGEKPGEGIAVDATDMQTAALLARARERGIAAAALLIVSEIDARCIEHPDGVERSTREEVDEEIIAPAARRGGEAAVTALL